jgi:HK97 family phage prohead protease
MKNIERRFINSHQVEVRATDKGNVLECLAVPYGTMSENLGGFIETIRKGAFNKSLVTNPDVRMLWNHDTNEPIGRAGKNMELIETDAGVACNVTLPKTTRANDIVELVRTGIITGMSFGFVANEDEWEEEDDMVKRTVVDATLFEISPVTFPAYSDSMVALRSVDNKDAMQSLKQFRDAKQSSLANYYETLDRHLALLRIKSNNQEII